ncbi:dCTP deaminase [Thermomicrobiaceae bacterium CFH 74404]|uniref:dCTP deaminase n=2 Tax=Thermomicrobia TaxID=189775 RepID=A0AA41WB12_9BACT|nr:dCTP deaminase [Thermalbibacter longus]MCM8749217.1 dCTP deaminase [Thermalbibacter longus]
MGILTRSEILRLIEERALVIEPFDPSQVGPASIDLHLGREFRIFRPAREIFHVTDEADHRLVTELVEVEDYFLLLPGQAVLGITEERITLPDDICGWIQGRSRFARVGLMVHVTANFMQPGMVRTRQVLEMNNAGPIPLAIHPGTAICQIILEECTGRARYEGRFQGQEHP